MFKTLWALINLKLGLWLKDVSGRMLARALYSRTTELTTDKSKVVGTITGIGEDGTVFVQIGKSD